MCVFCMLYCLNAEKIHKTVELYEQFPLYRPALHCNPTIMQDSKSLQAAFAYYLFSNFVLCIKFNMLILWHTFNN